MTNLEKSPEDSVKPVFEELTKEGEEQVLIAKAIEVLVNRLKGLGETVANPKDALYLSKLKMITRDKEEFWVMWLNSQHRLIKFEQLCVGTIGSCMVYPREFLESAFEVNAAACVLVHNHPSGDCKPSVPDKNMTESLETLTSLVGIRLLDHIIIAREDSYLFSENGLL